MPKFILVKGSAEAEQAFSKLSPFERGYIEAAFFTSTGPDNEEEGLGEDSSFSDLAPEAMAAIKDDCADFLAQVEQTRDSFGRTLLDLAFDYSPNVAYTQEQAGVDLWLTRNGHGAGFWDRGLGRVGEDLSKLARYSERSLYRGDDGLIYYQ